MMHARTYQVATVEDVAELAKKMTEMTWTLCTGFRHRGLLLLNDATCEDGAAEYAIIDEATGKQIESLTASWMSAEELAAAVTQYANGERPVAPWDPVAWPSIGGPGIARLGTTGRRFRIATETPHECGYCR